MTYPTAFEEKANAMATKWASGEEVFWDCYSEVMGLLQWARDNALEEAAVLAQDDFDNEAIAGAIRELK